jgi:hypothetical protein
MKIKQPTPKTSVVAKQESTAMALPPAWQQELAVSAKDATAVEMPTTQSFSTRAGVLSYNGQAMPNNQVDVVILAASFVNAMFINKFDPNNIVSPLCFAMSENGEDMAPNENSFKPQSEQCEGCEQAEWGSDPNSPSGRGKMCKETRKLAVMPAEAMTDGIEKAPVVTLNVPVTSVENWGGYVHLLAATAKRPAWSVITRITLKPHPKKQFVVEFEAVDAINSGEMLDQLKVKRESAMKSVLVPFGKMTQEQFDEITAPAPAKKAKKF